MEKNTTWKIELIEELPPEIPLVKEGTITVKGEWYGHAYGEFIGRIYDNGEVTSFFKNDQEEQTTELFDLLRNNGKTKVKYRYTVNRKTGQERGVEDHYVVYKLPEHGSEKQTVKEQCLNTCCNVKFEYTYEILFVADEEFKRYVYDTVKTDGPYTYGLTSILESLEDTIREWVDEEEKGFRFKDGTVLVKFYDDLGTGIEAEFNNISELLMCINSVRIVDLKCEVVY